MERFEHSIKALEEALKNAKAWRHIHKSNPKYQKQVEKYQAEVDDIQEAIRVLKHLRDHGFYKPKEVSAESKTGRAI